jgi:1,2-diacylglycerol-3-alpha-glucose alpha-1,2-galactosyltransferase
MKVHVCSESQFVAKGNGVHTAFVDHVDLLKTNGVDVVVNGQGWGDVFHCHTYGPYYFWKGLPYKGKRIHTVHVIPDSIKGSIPFYRFFMPLFKWYFKHVYSFADVCIAISPMVEEAILKLGAKTEIVRISNPIPLDRWRTTPDMRKEARAWLGLDDTDFVVLGVGQLQARKGVEDFMDVAAGVPNAKFVWAGGRPFKYFTEGVSRIDDRLEHKTENIQFTGMLELDQMPLVYAAADIMLFPSYQENCPMAPIEGAAAGLPVIFRDIPEYSQLYEHYYLKAGSTEEFIEMTQKLMTDSAYLHHGRFVSKQLILQFDKNQIIDKWIRLYERVNNHSTRLIPNWMLTRNKQIDSWRHHS